ncbi:hypothetical protein EO92_05845 [Methanosarcina sp. 2.H.A.1B.4]|nr:hypothetical protein EO92_05845 [Methanosarcina sp. 2.H.A.1B.4]KKH51015.1 hypothetical protein EO93_11670 [Methanosarcina sp. 1.H.A.2.2]
MQQNSGKSHKNPDESQQQHQNSSLEIKVSIRIKGLYMIKVYIQPDCYKSETWQSKIIQRAIKFHLVKNV